MEFISKHVHDLYWRQDINCARAMLLCLGDLFNVKYEPQVIRAAIGLHGAGGFRAQCGLVEGALMFIGIYYSSLGKNDAEIIATCYQYAEAFTDKFHSLRCFELRPNGFTPNDEPHMCEKLTCDAIEFSYEFIKQASEQEHA